MFAINERQQTKCESIKWFESKFIVSRFFNLFEQISSIVTRLEMAGIAHRDLKGDNILVDENENILVIEFGLAEYFETANGILCGTPGYLPPEVESCEAKYMIGPVSTWSLRVILGSLLIVREPFQNGRHSLEAKRVCKCFQSTKDNRPSSKEIRQDPWLSVRTTA